MLVELCSTSAPDPGDYHPWYVVVTTMRLQVLVTSLERAVVPSMERVVVEVLIAMFSLGTCPRPRQDCTLASCVFFGGGPHCLECRVTRFSFDCASVDWHSGHGKDCWLVLHWHHDWHSVDWHIVTWHLADWQGLIRAVDRHGHDCVGWLVTRACPHLLQALACMHACISEPCKCSQVNKCVRNACSELYRRPRIILVLCTNIGFMARPLALVGIVITEASRNCLPEVYMFNCNRCGITDVCASCASTIYLSPCGSTCKAFPYADTCTCSQTLPAASWLDSRLGNWRSGQLVAVRLQAMWNDKLHTSIYARLGIKQWATHLVAAYFGKLEFDSWMCTMALASKCMPHFMLQLAAHIRRLAFGSNVRLNCTIKQ